MTTLPMCTRVQQSYAMGSSTTATGSSTMPTTMSKFLHLGVPLERVIEMSTTRPAAVLGQADQLGTLRVGTVADVAVLERQQGRFVLTDSYRQDRTSEDLLVATTTVRRGELVPGGGGLRMRPAAE